MALGGGTFITYNKKLPGSYINFVSKRRTSVDMSDRGYVAMAMNLDWGPEGDIFTIELEDFLRNSTKLLGYDYTADEITPVREVFKNAKTVYMYRLNKGGTKASNTIAKAVYSGTAGNNITIEIANSVDNVGDYIVSTIFNGQVVDEQTVTTVTDLVKNDYVEFLSTGTLTAGFYPLENGTNATVTNAEYQTFLDKVEKYDFNTLICNSTETNIKSLFVQFTKRMRDDMGVKFQTVIHKADNPDYEGVINVKNDVVGTDTQNLVYWVAGASAGCAVNKSNSNKVYDGDYEVDVDYKQSELSNAIDDGEYVLHRVGDEIRVLSDISSFTSFTKDKNKDFANNQVVRVIDQIGKDIATLFNKQYLGKVQNNQSGRVSLWGDIVAFLKELERIQAVENVVAEEIIVERGENKEDVIVTCPVTPVSAMQKLYMTVIVA